MGEGKRGRAHDFARITLAGIRLFNGVAALFVPTTLARRLGSIRKPTLPRSTRSRYSASAPYSSAPVAAAGQRSARPLPACCSCDPRPRRHGGSDRR
jgi:hypothetical protein